MLRKWKGGRGLLSARVRFLWLGYGSAPLDVLARSLSVSLVFDYCRLARGF